MYVEILFDEEQESKRLIVSDVGMGIAIGAGALLIGGKFIEVFLGLCFCIAVFVAGGLAILGGKI